MLLSLFILFVLLLILAAYYPSLINPMKNALPIPSPPHHRKYVSQIVEQELLNRERISIVELGSGWGGMAKHCVKNPNVKFVGIEYNYFLYLFSKFKGVFYKNKPLYIFQDAYKTDTSSYDIIILFMGQEFNNEIEKNLKKGQIVISSLFTLPNYKPHASYKGLHIYFI